jgi:hypothetical protein
MLAFLFPIFHFAGCRARDLCVKIPWVIRGKTPGKGGEEWKISWSIRKKSIIENFRLNPFKHFTWIKFGSNLFMSYIKFLSFLMCKRKLNAKKLKIICSPIFSCSIWIHNMYTQYLIWILNVKLTFKQNFILLKYVENRFFNIII